jgi:predicted AAA+ superfamily ATPase
MSKFQITKYFYVSGAFTEFWKQTISFIRSVCPSVRPSVYINSVSTGRIAIKFDNWVFFESLSKKIQYFFFKSDKNKGYFT